MFILAVAIAAYLIGSFPTAYVIGKQARGIDISKNGTGNVGAMNAYEVTGSKMIGIAVGAIDIMKGTVATSLAEYALGPTAGIVAAFFTVLGHNYSIFLRFKGGRGLATAAGALLVIQPLCVAIYVVVYSILRLARLRLYLASVSGILIAGTPLAITFAKMPVIEIFGALLLIAVLSKHLVPLRNELRNGL